MKFAVNRYKIGYHAVITDPAPIVGARVEHLLYGLPPFEVRPIWTADIDDLAQLLGIVDRLGVSLDLSRSAYWTGRDFHNPGERLFGISLIDDPSYEVDPRDRPIRIAKRPDL